MPWPQAGDQKKYFKSLQDSGITPLHATGKLKEYYAGIIETDQK
jgi:hypothetical protein